MPFALPCFSPALVSFRLLGDDPRAFQSLPFLEPQWSAAQATLQAPDGLPLCSVQESRA